MTYNILYGEKKVIFHPSAEGEFLQLNLEVQEYFRSLMNILEKVGQLREPKAKKLKGFKNTFELRVRLNGQWRGFYSYIENDFIVILHFTNKKTQKTQLKTLKLVSKRLNDYE